MGFGEEEIVVVELHGVDRKALLQIPQDGGGALRRLGPLARLIDRHDAAQKLQRYGQPMLAWWTAVRWPRNVG